VPKLPSGLNIAISDDAILSPNEEWFQCPEGHFWYQTPDIKMNKPPFDRDTIVLQDFVNAPVPDSHEEAKKYIHVYLAYENDDYYWKGDWLSDFPKDGDLTGDDLIVWNEWLNSPDVLDYIDRAIEKCKVQAESDKCNLGYAKFYRPKKSPD